jgi:hypothetical protein
VTTALTNTVALTDSEGTLMEIVDDVFLPLVRPRPGEVGA